MAQAQEPFDPSSPRSSGDGADSYKYEGTPDTRLTAFSPDDGLVKSVKSLNLDSTSNTAPVRFPGQTSNAPRGPAVAGKDPFITSSTVNRKTDRRLSATATTFRPLSTIIAYGVSTDVQHQASVIPYGASNDAQHHTSLVPYGHPTDAQHHASPGVESQRPQSQTTVVLASEAQPSRYLAVTLAGSDAPIEVHHMEGYIAVLAEHHVASRGKVILCAGMHGTFIRFANIRDACDVHRCIRMERPEWFVKFMSSIEFGQATGMPEQDHTEATQEGKVNLTAIPPPGVTATDVEFFVCQVFATAGEILSFYFQPDSTDFQIRAIVEFADTEAAALVAKQYHGAIINNVRVFASSFKQIRMVAQGDGSSRFLVPPQSPPGSISAPFHGPGIPQMRGANLTPGLVGPVNPGLQFYPQVPVYPMVYNAPMPQPVHYVVHTPAPSESATSMSGSMPFMSPLYPNHSPGPLVHRGNFSNNRALHAFDRPDMRRQYAVRVNRSSYYNSANHHNHVDIKKIREGTDVRTTIMLRNIPNKVDQAMLKGIIDESSWGKYDFMYLRIDFANDCNVGYAFINFVDPLDIIDFVNARGNKRWNCFKSDKVAEISYATIQGKDCLVQKFRNSSVMLEASHYRPKLYYTLNGPMPENAGQEEPFPEPDNQSKMKRSVENAEHVGLFTPNAGQHFRDEQRRRRSQYDRGTRLAALEEFDYENAMHNQGHFLGQ